MSETQRMPAEVFSLAEMLCDEMAARGWTTDDVAEGYADSDEDIPRAALEVALLISIKDGLVLTDDAARRLGMAFGLSSQYFKNIDAQWRAHPDKQTPFSAPDELYGPIVRASLDGVSAALST